VEFRGVAGLGTAVQGEAGHGFFFENQESHSYGVAGRGLAGCGRAGLGEARQGRARSFLFMKTEGEIVSIHLGVSYDNENQA
jgi:hypothetical protein